MNWDTLKERYRQLGNFKTDGCTAAPDFFWKDCCKAHDFYYKNNKLTQVSRKEADKRLRLCMVETGKGKIFSIVFWPLALAWVYLTAWTYWAVVRMIGWKFWK